MIVRHRGGRIVCAASINEQVSFNFAKITSDVILNGTNLHSCFNLATSTSC
jgi:hypothetical protein